jgi:cell division protein FtsL
MDPGYGQMTMLARWRGALYSKIIKFRSWLRRRLQSLPSIGSARLVLFALCAFILVALIYLAQSSNAALVARDLRVKQLKIQEIERENAQLRYEIAALASPSAIEQRARKLGLGPAKRVVYADMPWIQPPPNELMPAFLPQGAIFSAPETFDTNPGSTLEQLLAIFGLENLTDRASAQSKE